MSGKDRKLSIAFSASAFRRGGAEQRVINLMEALSKEGHSVELICGDDVPWVEFPVRRVHGGDAPVISSARKILGFMWKFLSDRKGHDVIVANCYLSALAAVLVRRFTGTPVIKISYGPEPGHLSAAESGIKHKIIRYAYKRCDSVVTPSKWARDYVKRVFEKKSDVIPIGIDLKRFSNGSGGGQTRKMLGIGPNDIMVLYVGHMLKRKGLDDLLAAAAKVCGKRKDARFVFIGNSWGKKDREIRTGFVNQNGISNNVIFAGEVNNRKLPEYYSACDVFCMPSYEEALGIVFLEAMGLERPVVSTRVSAIPEVVDDGKTGLLVPVRDPEALSKAILRLAADRKLRKRMGEEGRKRVERLFDIRKEMKDFTALIIRAVSASRAR